MTNTTDSASAQPIRVALLGCGVVGSQVARMIESRTEDIAARVGRQVELAGIAVAHPDPVSYTHLTLPTILLV